MEEITVCPYCENPTEERSIGDEGFTFCSDGCGCLEGEKAVVKYVCEKCGDLIDFEVCNCAA
jgi:hypothetical protein